MNSKSIISLIVILSFLIAGGVFWWSSEKTGKNNFLGSAGVKKSLEESIKIENPEIAKRLEEETKISKQERVSLSDLNDFQISTKCFSGGFRACRGGVCKLEDGTICSKAAEIKGTKIIQTDTFRLEDNRTEIGYDFYIILNKLPSPEKNPAYRISLYKVGEEKPISTHSDITTLKQLKDMNWSPEKVYSDEPLGIAGGIGGAAIESPGPGEFYFKIEVENVDSWFLRVIKGINLRG